MKQTQEGTMVPKKKTRGKKRPEVIVPILDTDLPITKERKTTRNNKIAGNNYERQCAKDMREIGFPHVVTTRLESRARDNQKIDLMNKDEHIHGRLPYNIQCKNASSTIAYINLLVPRKVKVRCKKTDKLKDIILGMPKVEGVVNVIFHNYTEKSLIGGKFMSKGEFAILEKADFLAMVQELELFKIWKERNAKQLATSKIRKGEYPCTPDESFKVES